MISFTALLHYKHIHKMILVISFHAACYNELVLLIEVGEVVIRAILPTKTLSSRVRKRIRHGELCLLRKV